MSEDVREQGQPRNPALAVRQSLDLSPALPRLLDQFSHSPRCAAEQPQRVYEPGPPQAPLAQCCEGTSYSRRS